MLKRYSVERKEGRHKGEIKDQWKRAVEDDNDQGDVT